MGWTDKISDAWDKTAGGIGATWSFVNNTSPLEAIGLDSADRAIRSVAEPVTAPVRWAGETAFKGAMGGFEEAARIVGTPFKYAGRGISTATQVSGQANAQARGQLLFSQDEWAEAWERSKSISPGQAFMTNVNAAFQDAPFDAPDALTGGYAIDESDRFSEANQQARHDYFYNTPAGRMSSGSIDLWLNFVADPVGIAGDAMVAAGKARRLISPSADRQKIVDGSLGYGNDLTRAEARNAQQLSDLYKKTDGMSAAEMANLPQFRNTADSGIMSYFFEKANTIYKDDEAARHGLKADIMGVALGNQESIQRIQDFDAGLAFELERAGSTLTPANAVSEFKWDDAGKEMLEKYNLYGKEATSENKISILETERNRLERLLELDSGYSQTGATMTESAMAKFRNARLNETIIPNGMFGRPTRVVTGSVSTRVPGFVHVKDTQRGYQDMQSLVGMMRYTPVAEKKALLARFGQAGDDVQRRDAVAAAEARMFEDTAKHYGVKPETAREMLRAVEERRRTYFDSMKSRLYSAVDEDKLISHIDPEDDVEDVFSRPLLQTQIEAAHAVTDPRILNKALERGTNRRLLEAWTENRIAKRAGTKVEDMTDATAELLDDFATRLTRPWKDLMLMRGAYPLRIQVDTQMRLLAHMGVMQYMLEGKNAFSGLGRYALSVKDETINKELKAARATLGAKAEYKGEDITPGRTDDEVARAFGMYRSKGGSMADMGNDVQQEIIRGYRASGNFTRIDKADKQWFGHWKRAVQQIQGSPTAKQALITPDVEDLKEWMKTSPEGRKEYAALAAGRSADEWLGLVSAHANNYVPTGDIRQYVLRGGRGGLSEEASRIQNAEMSKVRLDAATFTDRRREAFQRKQDKKLEIENYRTVVKQAKDELAGAYALPGRGRKPRTRDINGQTYSMTDAAYKRQMVADAKQRVAEAQAELKRLRGEHKDLTGKHVRAVERSQTAAAALNNANRRKAEMLKNFEQGKSLDETVPTGFTSWKQAEDYFTSPEGQGARMDVHGESYSPIDSRSGIILQGIEKKRRAFYRIFADMPETVIGRSPLYSFTYKRYMRDALDKIPEGTIDGPRLERIRKGADKAARKEIANVLFDSSNMSNMSHTFRHLAPFFSAWEDTMKKWTKLIANDPQFGVNLTKAYAAPENAGLTIDSEGNRVDKWGNLIDPETGEIRKKPKDYQGKGQYIVIPGSWIPDKAFKGSFTINKDSANILFQGEPPVLPGAGPLVQYPTSKISEKLWADEIDSNPVLKYILPYGAQGVVDSALPAWAKQARNAMGDTDDHAATYAMLWAQEKTKFENGERATEPTPEEIANSTRNWFILRAAIGFQSPVSMMPRPEYQLYIDKAHQYKGEYGRDWLEKYYEDFPQYFRMGVSLSSNEGGIQATGQVYDALKDKKVRARIAGNPEYAWYFLGDNNTGNWDANVYKWLQSNESSAGKKLLGRKTPEQAINDTEVQVGWVQYSKGLAILDDVLESRGLYSYDLKGAEDLKEMKSVFINSIAQDNRAWWYAYNQRNDAKVQEFLDVAQKSWSDDPRFAQENGQKQLQTYIEARSYVNQILQSRPVTTLDHPDNADLAQAWGQVINSLKLNSPSFTAMYDRVLEGDKINRPLLDSAQEEEVVE